MIWKFRETGLDGTAAAKELFINLMVEDAGQAGDADLDLSGTIILTFFDGGDY